MADTSLGTPRDAKDGERPLRALRNWIRQLRRTRGGESMRDSLEEIIEEREEVAEPMDPQERMLIGNILKLHELTSADVMVQRVDILALEVETPFPEVVRSFVDQGHSRMPIYRETLDDVLGFVHIKDVLARLVEGSAPHLSSLMRRVLVVAPSMPVLDLLLQMRLSRIHMAMVADEFGGIDGLVTIEDLIEEIVGEIEDEHDEAAGPQLIERGDGSIIADARTPIEEFDARFGVRLIPEDSEEDVDTLGGLVFTLAGRVPARGEIIPHPNGAELEVLDADPTRVKRLRIRNLKTASAQLPSSPKSGGEHA